MERAIVEIEEILNSNVLAALTPGHFLVGEPLTAPADPDASERGQNLLSKCKLPSHSKILAKMDLRISKRAPVPMKIENTISKHETRDRRNLNKFSTFLCFPSMFLKAKEFKADTETRAPVTIPVSPLLGRPTNSISNGIISTNLSSVVRTGFQ